MANQLGLAAPPLVLNDTNDKKISLYDIASPYTFVAFWDPMCSHCKEEIPRVDSFYKAIWNKLNVKVLSVNINFKEIATWKTFINVVLHQSTTAPKCCLEKCGVTNV
jgi:thiol-disulfide isomerase/thioredoxin